MTLSPKPWLSYLIMGTFLPHRLWWKISDVINVNPRGGITPALRGCSTLSSGSALPLSPTGQSGNQTLAGKETGPPSGCLSGWEGQGLSRAPAHLPRCDDGTEGLQDVYGSKALLGVEDQQLPDETHGVLGHAPIPDAGQGEGSGGAGWAGSLQPTAPAQGVPLTQGWCTPRP